MLQTLLRLLNRQCVIFSLAACGTALALAAEADMRVVLLGTGSPVPLLERAGPATLVEAGGKRFLFDAGRGAPVRLWQIGIPTGEVEAIFLTHFHSDHTSGLPDLWLTGALGGGFGERKMPFRVIGPVGTKALMESLEKAYAGDIEVRLAEGKANGNIKPTIGFQIQAQEFAEDGVVHDRDGVRVTAFKVDHGKEITPAFGYRIDYKNRSVIISGDTRKDANVIKYSQGVDVLVHEVAAARPELMKLPIIKLIVGHHTTPREAGEVFTTTKPRLAVYTHLVLLSGKTVTAPTPAEVLSETRETYAGPLEVGEDLMSIEIGQDIVVKRLGASARN